MFDLPNAKRVCREELLEQGSVASGSSPPPAADYEDGHSRLGKLLNLDQQLLVELDAAGLRLEDKVPDSVAAVRDDEKAPNQEDEQEFDFRLFRAPAGDRSAGTRPRDGSDAVAGAVGAERSGTIQKLRIRLRSPTPVADGQAAGRFVHPFRGWEYYFSTPSLLGAAVAVTPAANSKALLRRRQYEDAAVSGEQLDAWAKTAWPGCDLPWRVICVKQLPGSKLCGGPVDSAPTPKSRKKPGKKRRIQLRKRIKAAQLRQETEAEKRNRKNRERRTKRRQKARDLKATVSAVASAQIEDAPQEKPE